MTNVYRFPLQNTKIWKWVNEAMMVRRYGNMVAVRLWCIEHVPGPFREVVLNYVKGAVIK